MESKYTSAKNELTEDKYEINGGKLIIPIKLYEAELLTIKNE